MIDLVVFDMAGTTVYDGDAVNSSFRDALAGVDLKASVAQINEVMGYAKPEAIRVLLTQAGRSPTNQQVDAVHDDFVARMRRYYVSDPSVRELPGASAAFTKLRGVGIKVALNTGFGRAIADAVLSRLGWRSPETVDAVVTSDEVPHGRPHPDMIKHLMGRLHIQDVRRVAKVGDTPVDLEEGTNAGCGLVIGVTTGGFPRAALVQLRHTHIVESVADVPAIVLAS